MVDQKVKVRSFSDDSGGTDIEDAQLFTSVELRNYYIGKLSYMKMAPIQEKTTYIQTLSPGNAAGCMIGSLPTEQALILMKGISLYAKEIFIKLAREFPKIIFDTMTTKDISVELKGNEANVVLDKMRKTYLNNYNTCRQWYERLRTAKSLKDLLLDVLTFKDAYQTWFGEKHGHLEDIINKTLSNIESGRLGDGYTKLINFLEELLQSDITVTTKLYNRDFVSYSKINDYYNEFLKYKDLTTPTPDQTAKIKETILLDYSQWVNDDFLLQSAKKNVMTIISKTMIDPTDLLREIKVYNRALENIFSVKEVPITYSKLFLVGLSKEHITLLIENMLPTLIDSNDDYDDVPIKLKSILNTPFPPINRFEYEQCMKIIVERMMTVINIPDPEITTPMVSPEVILQMLALEYLKGNVINKEKDSYLYKTIMLTINNIIPEEHRRVVYKEMWENITSMSVDEKEFLEDNGDDFEDDEITIPKELLSPELKKLRLGVFYLTSLGVIKIPSLIEMYWDKLTPKTIIKKDDGHDEEVIVIPGRLSHINREGKIMPDEKDDDDIAEFIADGPKKFFSEVLEDYDRLFNAAQFNHDTVVIKSPSKTPIKSQH